MRPTLNLLGGASYNPLERLKGFSPLNGIAKWYQLALPIWGAHVSTQTLQEVSISHSFSGLFTGHNPSGQEVPKIPRVESGRVKRYSSPDSRGSERVGPAGFQISRFGSGHPGPTGPAGGDPTREMRFFFFFSSPWSKL